MADEFAAQLDAMEALEGIRRSTAMSVELRLANGPPEIKAIREKHEKNKGNLKSDLKRCSTFVKKVRVINPEGLAQCLRDVETLNLDLYIEEIVGAIVESNFKSTDVPLLVKLSVQLHQRYSAFTPPMLAGLRDALLQDGDENGKRRRIQLRFVIELFQAGVMRDEEFFLQLLRHLLGKSPRTKLAAGQAKQATGVDVSGLVTFVKYAAEPLLGHICKRTLALVAASGSALDDISAMGLSPGITTARTAAELKQIVADAAENMSTDLVKTFAEFKRCEKRSEKEAVIHGALTEQKQQELDGLRKLYEKLLSAVSSIFDCLDLDMPILKEEKEEGTSSGGLSVWDGTSVVMDYGPFGDAESKQFYDELPDLLVMVPLTALGLTSQQAATMKEEWQKKKEEAFLQGEGDETLLLDVDSVVGKDDGAVEDMEVDEAGNEGDEPSAAGEDDGSAPSGTSALRLNVLLSEKLPECNSRQRADDFSSSFCYVNSKKARRSLVMHLSRIPKGRSELIPHYARIVASLSRLYKDIAPPVLDSLYGCFIGKFKSKMQFDFDGKSRNIRYIGELVKFSVAPPIMAFRIFQKLFQEFVNQNVLLCAILLETCGRFLYLLPYTHDRTEAILDTVLRLRRAKNLDSNCQMALESAYFSVKPPERKELRKKKELTKLQQYIRHLFTVKMTTASGAIDKVIRELRKLPWSMTEEKVEFHVIKACLRVVRTKYTSIPLVADTIAGLVRYHPKLQVNLLDTITEDFLRGMDSPRKREPQRLLGLSRLLGECYNYSMINSSIIFDFLYLFLNYGHEVAATTARPASATSPAVEALVAAVPTTGKKASVGDGGDATSSAAGSNSPVSVAKLAGDVLRQFQDLYDATAPSDIDSPTDLFRAQLVVEVLRACGSYFVRGVLKDRLSRFLLHFQRYLLCKAYIPMHIEFTILELFDELEALAASAALKVLKAKKPPKGKNAVVLPDLASMTLIFPRFDTLEAVQEEITLRYGEDAAECDTAIEAADEEEEDEVRLVPGEDIADEATGGETAPDEEEDMEGESSGGEENDDAELSESNAAQLMASLRQQEEEDEEFERAFRSAMLESVSSAQKGGGDLSSVGSASSAAGGGLRVTVADRMARPAVLPKPKNVYQLRPSEEDGDSDEESDMGPGNVKFKLLSRDHKGRFETREFAVTKDAPMVARLEKANEQQRLEKQKLKETVLRYEKESVAGKSSGIVNNTVPVAYLGGKDHFSGKKPSQSHLASTKYHQPSSGGGEHRMDVTAPSYIPPVAPTGRNLNLGEFLAVSQQAELRKYQSSVHGGSQGSNTNNR